MAGGSVTERPEGAEPFGGGVNGAVGGLAIVGLLVWLAVSNHWMFLFVVGILVSVFLHETGHFVTARLTGMKATQFFLGFGPRLWSFQRGETEYGVRLLPLGAFVRIIGMNNLDEVPLEDEGRTYRQQSFPRRLLVISAGSIMHMLIAIVLFFSVFATKGQIEGAPGAEIRGFAEQVSPAAAAGLQAEDVVLSVGGVVIDDDVLIGDAVRQHQPGDTVEIVYVRDGVQRAVDVTLGENPGTDNPDVAGTAFLGVSTRGVTEWRDMSIGSALTHSVTDLFPNAWESTKGVVKVLNPVNIFDHLTGESDDLTTRPTTLVGATDVSGTIGSEEGLAGILLMLAALNVFIGVFNMFPLLPLDGGHAAIAVYERVREIGRNGRRYFTDVSRLMPFTMGVIVVLLFLFMSGLYLDIAKPL
jgi:membrane-associated protease RseP (regulator of RpoE activity)